MTRLKWVQVGKDVYSAEFGKLGPARVAFYGGYWSISINNTHRSTVKRPSVEAAQEHAEKLALRYVREALKLLEGA